MKLIKLLIFFCGVLLISSCGGYMIETGLSQDRGKLNELNGPSGASGTGATLGMRYKKMLWDQGSGQHGIGGEMMLHLNGYGTIGESNPFFYRSISGRYYYLVNPDDSYVHSYLSGSFGFGGQSAGRDNFEKLVLVGASIDFHFFQKEFIYLSPKVNYIYNTANKGSGLSLELTFGIMFRFENEYDY